MLRKKATDRFRVWAKLWGPVVTDPSHLYSLGATMRSSNTGELSLIAKALLRPRDRDCGTAPALLCYDSQYAANITQGIYTARSNKGDDLADALVTLGMGIDFVRLVVLRPAATWSLSLQPAVSVRIWQHFVEDNQALMYADHAGFVLCSTVDTAKAAEIAFEHCREWQMATHSDGKAELLYRPQPAVSTRPYPPDQPIAPLLLQNSHRKNVRITN
jgi:hypothetical protein